MKNKILFVYNDSNIVGGHEILTARILNQLSTEHQVTVHFAFACEKIGEHLDDSIHPYRLPFHGKSPHFFHSAKSDFYYVKQLVQSIAPDLALISQGYIESGIRGVIGCRLAGVPTGSYIPFGQTNRELGNKYSALRDILAKPIYRLNQFYLTISNFQAQSLSRLIQQQPVYLVNNPVAYSPIAPITPQDIQLDEGDPYLHIAVIGRVLFKQKHQDCLIPIANRLRERGYLCRFHIVGDGPDLEELKRRATEQTNNIEDAGSQFTFHHWLNKEQLASLLADKIHAVFLPSHYEGLPLVFLESICQGKPVIISDMPFARDYDLPKDYIVDTANIENVCEKIMGLPHLNNRKNIIQLQEKVLTTNSFERYTQDIANAFSSLFSTLAK